ncbi:hypothetical protein LX32DRAFT_167466 [Colletotrichum zoysiae]|uniref:Uncharacterized protein n=1 Tax=Colletotrichum zoysiae TaxID=1216348 RepID=A0AAD9HQN5_9PEZI|nr:hypothetical protein LX32DRAFT_167466 [Colletotrichum zoysiae]
MSFFARFVCLLPHAHTYNPQVTTPSPTYLDSTMPTTRPRSRWNTPPPPPNILAGTYIEPAAFACSFYISHYYLLFSSYWPNSTLQFCQARPLRPLLVTRTNTQAFLSGINVFHPAKHLSFLSTLRNLSLQVDPSSRNELPKQPSRLLSRCQLLTSQEGTWIRGYRRVGLP